MTPKGGTNPEIRKRFRGPKGTEIEFDPATPGARKGTHGEIGHWHEIDPTGHRVGDYLPPGSKIPGPDGEEEPTAVERVKGVVVGVAVCAALLTGGTAAAVSAAAITVKEAIE